MALCLSVWAPASNATSLGHCQDAPEPSAAVQDRLIQVAALVKAELDRSGRPLAVVARSGQALDWLGHRYSHAGLALKDSPRTPWAVRQLYFACDELRPRVFDQGMSGFVLGVHDAAEGHVSLLMLPADASESLAQAALSDDRALAVLGRTYSANAFAFSQRYQNCNQWLAELIAATWAPPQPDAAPPDTQTLDVAHHRSRAQQWLHRQGYRPSVMAVSGPLKWLAALMPWLHTDDHPPDDVATGRFRVSMPIDIEQFVRAQWPSTTRVELCHTDRHAVIRRGGEPLAPGCRPEAGDEVFVLSGH